MKKSGKALSYPLVFQKAGIQGAYDCERGSNSLKYDIREVMMVVPRDALYKSK